MPNGSQQMDAAKSSQPTDAAKSGQPTSAANSEHVPGDDITAIVTAELTKQNSRLMRKFAQEKAQATKEALDPIRDALGLQDDEDIAEKLADIISGKKSEDSEARVLKRKLTIEEKERDELRATSEKYRKAHRDRVTRGALLEAAGVDSYADDVAELLRGRVAVDEEDKAVVLDDNGDVAHGMTIQQLVQQTLEKKPYLRRPTAGSASGSGSLPSRGANNGAGMPDLKTAEGRQAWITANAPHLLSR